jgi:hypothetical protein
MLQVLKDETLFKRMSKLVNLVYQRKCGRSYVIVIVVLIICSITLVMMLIIVVKYIFDCFFNRVGHYNYIRQVIKYMFWYYEHFLPVNKCNLIEISVMNHVVDH